MLSAPDRQGLDTRCGSLIFSSNFHHICNTEPAELPDLPAAGIFVRQPSAEKLKVFSAGRVHEHRNAFCHALPDEIARLKDARPRLRPAR